MKKYLKVFLLLIGGLFLFFLGMKFSSKTENKINNPSTPGVEVVQTSASGVNPIESLVKVTRVVDGDTIEIEGGKRVRLIGMDTPEINKTGETGCFGREAADYAIKLLTGQMIKMEKDISEVDRYNRLLRYVYVGDTMINDKLVRDGYARVYTYPPDVKYKDKFLESEKYARENNLGLWSKCGSSLVPTSSQSPDGNQGSINCSSNSYNCGDFKTQAEAQNVFETCGGIPNDIHKLDRDGDGRVCETLP